MAATSIWRLPLADRGVIHSILTSWLDVGGRRPGFLTGYRYKGDVRFGVYGGAFEGAVQTTVTEGDRNTSYLFERSLTERKQLGDTPLLPSLFGKVELSVSALEFGMFYQHRVGSPAQFEVNHYFTAGADVSGEVALPWGALRFLADVVTGESWYRSPGIDPGTNPTFISARVVAAHSFGGREDEAFYVEPYLSLGAFEPDIEVTSDMLREAALGVNVGLWRRARLTLEGQSIAADRNFPLTTSGFFGGADPDGLSVLLQAGVSY
jgi:hypothetical protein